MDFFEATGYTVYGLSTIAAGITGAFPLLLLLGAAAFVPPSNLWLFTFYSAVVTWFACFLVPLIFLAARLQFPSFLGILGSAGIVLYSGYALAEMMRLDKMGSSAAPIPLWMVFPLVFNLIQAVLSCNKLKQIRSLSR